MATARLAVVSHGQATVTFVYDDGTFRLSDLEWDVPAGTISLLVSQAGLPDLTVGSATGVGAQKIPANRTYVFDPRVSPTRVRLDVTSGWRP